MVHVKTAISLDESLFREAEEWAGSWGPLAASFMRRR